MKDLSLWTQRVVSAIVTVAVGGVVTSVNAEEKKMTMEKCYGIVKKGMNDCGANNHSCSAFAKVDNDPNEWILVPTGTCQKIVNSSLKPKDKFDPSKVKEGTPEAKNSKTPAVQKATETKDTKTKNTGNKE